MGSLTESVLSFTSLIHNIIVTTTLLCAFCATSDFAGLDQMWVCTLSMYAEDLACVSSLLMCVLLPSVLHALCQQ